MNLRIVVLQVMLSFAILGLGIAKAQTMAPGQGIDDVEVIKTTATVEKIDLEKRKLTLRLEDGKKKTYKVDKSVQNLDQVAVGDHLNLAYTEELLVIVTKSNESPASASLESVSVAPKGAKPGAVSVEATAISGKILAVDPQKHKVTLLDADDRKKTVKVGKNVGIDQLKPGETVNALLTESLVVDITK
jgi:Cu/Ag efflux protein CusF